MTFEQLSYFEVLAETLNYTKAADMLYISQPTLSRQILLLEEEFHTKLFVRSYKSLCLTPAGESFLEECKRLLLDEKKLRERMEWYRIGSRGTLVCSTLGMYYQALHETYRRFREDNEDINFIIRQYDTGDVKASVETGEADFGICFSFELTAEDHFEVAPLYRENFKVVVPDSHLFANRESISISELQNERVILLGHKEFPFISNMWQQLKISNAFQSAALNKPSSLSTIRLNIQAGNYISMFPSPMTKQYMDGCVALELEDFDSSFDTILIWKKENTNPALKIMLEDIFDEFGIQK